MLQHFVQLLVLVAIPATVNTQATACHSDCDDMAVKDGGWKTLCADTLSKTYCGACDQCQASTITTAVAPTTVALTTSQAPTTSLVFHNTIHYVDHDGQVGNYTGYVDSDGNPSGRGSVHYNSGIFFVGDFLQGDKIDGVLYHSDCVPTAVIEKKIWKGTSIPPAMANKFSLENSATKSYPFMDREGDTGNYIGPLNAEGAPTGSGRVEYSNGKDVFVGEFCNGVEIQGVAYHLQEPIDTLESGKWKSPPNATLIQRYPFTPVQAVPTTQAPITATTTKGLPTSAKFSWWEVIDNVGVSVRSDPHAVATVIGTKPHGARFHGARQGDWVFNGNGRWISYSASQVAEVEIESVEVGDTVRTIPSEKDNHKSASSLDTIKVGEIGTVVKIETGYKVADVVKVQWKSTGATVAYPEDTWPEVFKLEKRANTKTKVLPIAAFFHTSLQIVTTTAPATTTAAPTPPASTKPASATTPVPSTTRLTTTIPPTTIPPTTAVFTQPMHGNMSITTSGLTKTNIEAIVKTGLAQEFAEFGVNESAVSLSVTQRQRRLRALRELTGSSIWDIAFSAQVPATQLAAAKSKGSALAANPQVFDQILASQASAAAAGSTIATSQIAVSGVVTPALAAPVVAKKEPPVIFQATAKAGSSTYKENSVLSFLNRLVQQGDCYSTQSTFKASRTAMYFLSFTLFLQGFNGGPQVFHFFKNGVDYGVGCSISTSAPCESTIILNLIEGDTIDVRCLTIHTGTLDALSHFEGMSVDTTVAFQAVTGTHDKTPIPQAAMAPPVAPPVSPASPAPSPTSSSQAGQGGQNSIQSLLARATAAGQNAGKSVARSASSLGQSAMNSAREHGKKAVEHGKTVVSNAVQQGVQQGLSNIFAPLTGSTASTKRRKLAVAPASPANQAFNFGTPKTNLGNALINGLEAVVPVGQAGTYFFSFSVLTNSPGLANEEFAFYRDGLKEVGCNRQHQTPGACSAVAIFTLKEGSRVHVRPIHGVENGHGDHLFATFEGMRLPTKTAFQVGDDPSVYSVHGANEVDFTETSHPSGGAPFVQGNSIFQAPQPGWYFFTFDLNSRITQETFYFRKSSGGASTTKQDNKALGCEVGSGNVRCRASGIMQLETGDTVGIRSTVASHNGKRQDFYTGNGLTINDFSGFYLGEARVIHALCFHSDKEYRPVMTVVNNAHDAEDCQKHCEAHSYCYYFSFHLSTKTCRLADKDSKAYQVAGFVSGPWSCRPGDQHGGLVTTTENVLMKKVLPGLGIAAAVAGGGAGLAGAIYAMVHFTTAPVTTPMVQVAAPATTPAHTLAVLSRPIDNFQMVMVGQCGQPVQTVDECSLAGAKLGLNSGPAVSDYLMNSNVDPPWCYFGGGKLLFNAGSNHGACSAADACLCKASAISQYEIVQQGSCLHPITSLADCNAAGAATLYILGRKGPLTASMFAGSGSTVAGCYYDGFSLLFNPHGHNGNTCSPLRPCYCKSQGATQALYPSQAAVRRESVSRKRMRQAESVAKEPKSFALPWQGVFVTGCLLTAVAFASVLYIRRKRRRLDGWCEGVRDVSDSDGDYSPKGLGEPYLRNEAVPEFSYPVPMVYSTPSLSTPQE